MAKNSPVGQRLSAVPLYIVAALTFLLDRQNNPRHLNDKNSI